MVGAHVGSFPHQDGWEAKKRATEQLSRVAVVNTTSLKVREQPNTECEVITLVPNGEELEVVEEMDDWVKIMIDEEENYVSAEYVKIEEKLGSCHYFDGADVWTGRFGCQS